VRVVVREAEKARRRKERRRAVAVALSQRRAVLGCKGLRCLETLDFQIQGKSRLATRKRSCTARRQRKESEGKYW